MTRRTRPLLADDGARRHSTVISGFSSLGRTPGELALGTSTSIGTTANGTVTASRYVGLVAGGPLGPFFTQKELTPDDVSALYEMGREALGL